MHLAATCILSTLPLQLLTLENTPPFQLHNTFVQQLVSFSPFSGSMKQCNKNQFSFLFTAREYQQSFLKVSGDYIAHGTMLAEASLSQYLLPLAVFEHKLSFSLVLFCL